MPSVLPALYDDLRARRIELGVFAHPAPNAKEDIHHDMLLEDGLVVVVGTENPWARRRQIKLADLVNEPWTWPTVGTAFDRSVVEAFRTGGLEPPRAAVYADAINVRTRLAANGRFLAVVPAHIMRFGALHFSLKVLPVVLPGTQRRIGIATLKNRTLSPLARRFIERANEIAKQLAKRKSS